MNEGIFHPQFMRQGHHWKFYEAHQGELPSKELLSNVKAIIYPGARFSVYEDLPWIHKMKEFTKMVYNDYPHIKLVGICFGH
jgi:GMP synthase-like glutamine amidotransferase